MPLSSRTALCATVASADPCGADLPVAAVGQLERCRDAVRLLLQADQLGVPLDRYAQVTKLFPHDHFVVVLAENEDVGIGRRVPPGFAERDAGHLPALRPHIRARAALAELQRPIDDAELRVDLQGAGLHAERSRLQRRPGMPVDDPHPHAPPNQLIGEHQPGRTGAHDQNVRVHSRSLDRTQRALFGQAPANSRNYFWMQVSTVSLVHSSRPVNTGSATCLPSIRSIMTEGAL